MGKISAFATIVMVILVVSVKSANPYPTPSVPLEIMEPSDACLFRCSNCLRDQVKLLACVNRICPTVKSLDDIGYGCKSFLTLHKFDRRGIFNF